MDWLYPARIPVFVELSRAWRHDTNTMTAILKLVAEIADNNSKVCSLDWDCVGTDHVLLYSECLFPRILSCQLYCSNISQRLLWHLQNIHCCKQVMTLKTPKNRIAMITRLGLRVFSSLSFCKCSRFILEICVGTCSCFHIIRRCLDGCLVDLGTMKLYNDPSLNAVSATLDMLISIPIEDVIVRLHPSPSAVIIASLPLSPSPSLPFYRTSKKWHLQSSHSLTRFAEHILNPCWVSLNKSWGPFCTFSSIHWFMAPLV